VRPIALEIIAPINRLYQAMNNDSSKPLFWPFDWNSLSGLQKSFLEFPFFGARARAHREIISQLTRRSVECLAHWDNFSEKERELAKKISKIVCKCFAWPNEYFLPDDPFEIMIWERSGDFMATTEAIATIENELGLKQKTSAEWESLMKQNYGKVIQIISSSLENKT